MGVSFKVARVGSRYRPRIPPPDPADVAHGDAGIVPLPGDGATDPLCSHDPGVSLVGLDDGLGCFSVFSTKKENKSLGIEHEASFSLNLYPNGFFIGKPTEGMLLPLLEDVPKLLHPYDRASKTLFSAIEYGWLPGDILDDIPCKYYNGTLFCEVWDFRSCMSKMGYSECDSSHDEFPKVQTVCLRMGTENVVKDMQSISDDSWTYDDLLQVESQIVKSLQPKLYLCPEPSLDRLCSTPASKKLDLGVFRRRSTRKQHDKPEIDLRPVTLDISCSRIIENLKPQTSGLAKHGALCYSQNSILRSTPFIQENNDQNGILLRTLQMAPQPYNISDVGCSSSVPNTAAVVPSFLQSPDHNPKDPFLHTKCCVALGKRNQSPAESAQNTGVKRPKKGPWILDPLYLEKDAFPGWEEERRVKLSQKQQEVQTRQHVGADDQHCCPPLSEASTIKISKVDVRMFSHLYEAAEKGIAKEEPTQPKVLCRPDVGKTDEENLADIRSKISKMQLSILRSLPPRLPCDNGPSIVKRQKKENASRKRKLAQGSQVSAESSDQFPVSQMGENQSMLLGTPRRTCPEVIAVKLQKEDSVVVPAASVETASMTFASDSSFMQESQMILKKKPKALSSVLSKDTKGINFEASAKATCVKDRPNVSLTGIPPALARSEANNNTAILERFSKIEMITQRYRLSCKNKVDNHLTNKRSPCSLAPPVGFLMPEDSEESGGSKNACKTRILTYRRVRFFFAGNSLPFLASESWCKLVLTEFDEPCDHKVGAEIIHVTEEKRFHIALLPTPHYADLFAAQFTSLMEHDGYELMNDQSQHSSTTTSDSSFGSSIHIGFSDGPLLPYTTANMDHSWGTVTPLVNSISTIHLHRFPHQNILRPTRMASPFSLTRSQQLEVSSDLSFMQQQIANGWRPMPLHEKTLGNVAVPHSPAFLPLIHLQQSPQQSRGIFQSKVGVVTENDVMCREAHVSSTKLKQISGFHNSCWPFLNRGTTQTTQAVNLAKIRQPQGLGTGIDLVTRHTGYVSGMSVDGPLERSNIYPFQVSGKSPLLTNKPSIDSCIDTCHHQHQLHMDLPESLLLNLQHHKHQQLGSPGQHNLPVTAQMRGPTAVSRQQLPRVAGRQVGSGIANVGSPQLSSQTVGSGGSITSSAMEVLVMKENNHSKDSV